MGDTEPKPKRDDFRIAVICALALEGSSLDVLFDKHFAAHELAFSRPSNMSFGRMGQHFVLFTWLGDAGKVSAGVQAELLKKKFEKIEAVFIAGICGAMPVDRNNNNVTIALGDVIISKGIIQYDEGKREKNQWVPKHKPQRPEGRGCLDRLEQMRLDRDALKRLAHSYSDLALEDDKFKYLESKKGLRSEVHFGYVASGDTVVKTEAYRNEIEGRLSERPIGFEMESSGVLPAFGDKVIVIKGVSDFADERKNDEWHSYAALMSIAYMKAFLNELKAKKSKRQYFHEKAHGIKGSVTALKSVIPSKPAHPDPNPPNTTAASPLEGSEPPCSSPLTAVQNAFVAVPFMAIVSAKKEGGNGHAYPNEASNGASGVFKTDEPSSTPTKALVTREPVPEQSPVQPPPPTPSTAPTKTVQPPPPNPSTAPTEPVRPPSPTPSTAPTLCESPKNDIHTIPPTMAPTMPIKKAPLVHVVLYPAQVLVKNVLTRSQLSQETSDMFAACKTRNISDIKRLLETGRVDLTETEEGHNMLGLVIGKVKVNTDAEKLKKIAAIVTLLCGAPHKANPNTLDKFGYAPIHYCARSMNASAAVQLIKHRAKINMLDKNRCTALNHLVNDTIPDVDFAKLLIANGGRRGPVRLDPLPKSANARRKAVYTAAVAAGTV
ncbi:nucleoside phosphorylase domain-containing protein [Phaeosphaeriaceae sp. PMI808]|nr:nucleoside phosphorylase domain-containing protein [Phaeosphaeriaceae sp. PMI808]